MLLLLLLLGVMLLLLRLMLLLLLLLMLLVMLRLLLLVVLLGLLYLVGLQVVVRIPVNHLGGGARQMGWRRGVVTSIHLWGETKEGNFKHQKGWRIQRDGWVRADLTNRKLLNLHFVTNPRDERNDCEEEFVGRFFA